MMKTTKILAGSILFLSLITLICIGRDQDPLQKETRPPKTKMHPDVEPGVPKVIPIQQGGVSTIEKVEQLNIFPYTIFQQNDISKFCSDRSASFDATFTKKKYQVNIFKFLVMII